MDIYDSRYFNINKSLMKTVGLWPYDNRIKNICLRFSVFLSMLIVTIPQVISFYLNFGKDTDKILENIYQIFYNFGMTVKVIATIAAEEELKIVYERTARNFQTLVKKHEQAILFQYAERGRYISLIFMVGMVFALNVYITAPLIPIILDVVSPLNESRPRLFINAGEFLVDKYKYYEEIYFFDAWTGFSTIFILCSTDPMMAAIVEHCLALFAIIKFTRLLEMSYTTYFFVELGMSILMLSITSVVVLIRRDQPFECARFAVVLIGLTIHLFYLTWPSQKIIDYSTNLFQDTYLNEWYDISIKNQNLLKFMALRCSTPCQLTAGGLYVVNFYNFALVVKTSVSYITVFSSFR